MNQLVYWYRIGNTLSNPSGQTKLLDSIKWKSLENQILTMMQGF